jgi:hypothetical protein
MAFECKRAPLLQPAPGFRVIPAGARNQIREQREEERMRTMWKVLIPTILAATLAGCGERTETYGYRSGPAYSYQPSYGYEPAPGYSYHYSYYNEDDDWRWRWRHRHDED